MQRLLGGILLVLLAVYFGISVFAGAYVVNEVRQDLGIDQQPAAEVGIVVNESFPTYDGWHFGVYNETAETVYISVKVFVDETPQYDLQGFALLGWGGAGIDVPLTPGKEHTVRIDVTNNAGVKVRQPESFTVTK